MDCKQIIDKKIINIDDKICGIIDDYKILQDPQKVADYSIQFLRTYLEHIAARIYADNNPNKEVKIRGKDSRWFTQYMKAIKEDKTYGYIRKMHDSLQIATSHYVPEDDGAIRLMEMYLTDLYHLRDQMKEKFGINLLKNLEEYPQEKNSELDLYYKKIGEELNKIQFDNDSDNKFKNDRYYIINKRYRTVNGKGFFEYTLSYAQEEITKFDRFVAYSLMDIPDNYAIQCGFSQIKINYIGIDIDIKYIYGYQVSIRPCELEKLVKFFGNEIKVRSDARYYKKLMTLLSDTSINLLDIIISEDDEYENYINRIELIQQSDLYEAIRKIRKIIINEEEGCNVLRYLVAYLKNDVIRDQLAGVPNNRINFLYLKNEAIPFDDMPLASSLYKHNVMISKLFKCLNICDCEDQLVAFKLNKEAYDGNMLYLTVENDKLNYYLDKKKAFNDKLYSSKRQQLRAIENFENHFYIKDYYESTKEIIEKLQQYSLSGYDNYSDLIFNNIEYINLIDDSKKQEIVKNIFVNSRMAMIYGAAGTGKTKIAEHIAFLFSDKDILLLANTNAAKNNLASRIGDKFENYTIYNYLSTESTSKKYDLVIIDECSTVCNEDFLKILKKCKASVWLLLGDIYQIESIKFGNWFNFARFFLEKNLVYELSVPYRAKDKDNLINMWNCVRKFDEHMFEILQSNGYISDLDVSLFDNDIMDKDEIVMCLGYDGIYGINNINYYFQKLNKSKAYEWGNSIYKVGDKILFNENKRFGTVLYNNLKGKIISIKKKEEEITFQIEVNRIISRIEAINSGLKLINCCEDENKTTVEFGVKKRVEKDSDSDYSDEVIPFQIAYAVSIHKAQGLEYKSVKVVISEDMDEIISHNAFYTAITRTTDKLKIYMTKETQRRLAERFKNSNIALQQAQLFAGQTRLKCKNMLSN